MASEWDALVKEWLVDSGSCFAGGLANAEDCAMYAAAAVDDEDPWAYLYKADYQLPVMQDDGSEAMTSINEPASIKKALETAGGKVYIGGEKFNVVRVTKDFEHKDYSYTTSLGVRNRQGVHLIKTQSGTVVVALYNEERDQNSSNALEAALGFADFLSTSGY